MWRSVKKCFVFVSCLFFVSPAICSAETTYQVTETQLTTLETELIELKQNTEILRILLTESDEELTTAKKQLEISESQLKILTSQLQQVKKDSERAKESLRTANAELENVLQSVKKSENRRRRIEKQRDFWEVLACIATIWGISRG